VGTKTSVEAPVSEPAAEQLDNAAATRLLELVVRQLASQDVSPENAVSDLVLAVLSEDAGAETDLPALPAPVELTADQQVALRQVPAVFNSVPLMERRVLSENELTRLTDEALTLSTALGPLSRRLEAIKETVRHHLDATARASGAGLDATPRDPSGHLILALTDRPFEVKVRGYARGWQQRLVRGNGTLRVNRLQELHASGALTREELQQLTRPARVFAPDRALSLFRGSPHRAAQLVRWAGTRKPVNASLHLPER
jgi:hypothetical protein